MGLKDVFSKIKTSLIGTTTLKVDNDLDKAIKDIASYKTNSGRLGYIELLRSLINKQGNLFGDINIDKMGQASPTPAMYGQSGRLARYKTYDSIISNITYCYRALNVITDNILSPDDISKQSLDIKPKSYLEDEINTESKVKMVKEIIKSTKLEKNLDIIVKNTLLFGDFFVEIGDDKTAIKSKSYLAENINNAYYDRDSFNVISGNDKYNIIMDYGAFTESKNDNNNKNSTDIKLMFHEPKNVVVLQSETFPVCFGYLIFPKYITGHQYQSTGNSVDDICSSILKNLEKRIPEISELKNNNELKDIIKYLINSSSYGSGRSINIRFVQPDKMQHFKVQSTKFYPYGESIFDSIVFSAKLLISMETALVIQRLSRSTEKRKISVEIGLPRDAKKMIESLKEQFRKRKISIDSFGTIDAIPSMITTFEDVYIPMKDGKPFVDIQTDTGGNVDIRSKVDELKFIRDELIASLSVPPPFIGIEENVNIKATLSDENVLFARSIITHQKYLSSQISDLIYKIITIMNPEESLTILDNVNITFPSPKSLQFEMLSRRINDTVNLIETLERIGIPKEYSKKKYLEDIDWGDVENYKIGKTIDQKLGIENKEETNVGGMVSTGGIPGEMF